MRTFRRVQRLLTVPVLTIALMFGLATSASAVGNLLVVSLEFQGPLPGPEPREANSTDNEFRPDDYEQNFLWGAAVGLGALTLAGAGGLGALYWLLVQRPANKAEEERQKQSA